jgi:hypothetical protein
MRPPQDPRAARAATFAPPACRWRLVRRFHGSLCALAAGALLACWAFAAAAPALASRNQLTFFDDTEELLNPATRPNTIATLQHLGVDALRLDISWRESSLSLHPRSPRRPAFEGTNPASYSWGEYPAVIAEANRLHWPVLLTVSSPVPKWATSTHRDFVTRPNDRYFREFMTALGREFGSSVTFYGIWNEPNQTEWLLPQWNSHGQPVSPRIYRGLYQAGYQGLRESGLANPKVLIGETAPFGFSSVNPRKEGRGIYSRDMSPLVFLRGTLCLNRRYQKARGCGMLRAYGYGHHAYTINTGPRYLPPNPDDVPIGALGRLWYTLKRAAGARALPRVLPIYITEFGVLTKPNRFAVSPTTQAQFDALAEQITWRAGYVASFAQYLLRDDMTGPNNTSFPSGLEGARGRPKPLYQGFPVQLVVNRVRGGYQLWGHVRPARGATSVQVLVQRKHGGRFTLLRTVHTGASGYWTLRSRVAGRFWRVRWVSPEGVRYEGPPIPSS